MRTAEVFSTEHGRVAYGAARPQMMRWASNLKISVLPFVTSAVTIGDTHGCLGRVSEPHPRVIVLTGRACLVRECKHDRANIKSGSCRCRAVSGIPIPNSHHQVHWKEAVSCVHGGFPTGRPPWRHERLICCEAGSVQGFKWINGLSLYECISECWGH